MCRLQDYHRSLNVNEIIELNANEILVCKYGVLRETRRGRKYILGAKLHPPYFHFLSANLKKRKKKIN